MALVILAISQRSSFSVNKMILTGIGMQAMLQAVINFIILKTSDYNIADGLRWLSGSLNGVRMKDVPVFAAVVVVALIGVGVYIGLRYHDAQMDVASRVNALVDRLTEADDTLVAVDGLMADPFDAEKAAERTAAIGKAPKVTAELNRISVDAQSLAEYPLDDKTTVVVDQIDKAAQTRISMLTLSTEAFRLSSEAADQVSRANREWNDVLNADQLAREAMSAANRAITPEATQQALETTRSAISGFEAASAELANMSATYGVDFAGQQAYLAKKVEALGKAVETSEALLAGDRDAATEANEAYNATDAEAVALASDLPPAIGDLVQAQFERKMTDCQKRYDEARSRTVEADSIIRDYLG